MTTTKPETVKARVKARKAREQAEAQETLRTIFPAGSVVTTILSHVSSSGMSRGIKVVVGNEDGSVRDVSHLVALATDSKMHDKGGVKVGGCGMDMGFHLVYGLARALYGAPGAFTCSGDRGCPANDHCNERGEDKTNGYRPGRVHSDGGYALRHRWA